MPERGAHEERRLPFGRGARHTRTPGPGRARWTSDYPARAEPESTTVRMIRALSAPWRHPGRVGIRGGRA
jgi:hypothetical protein